MAQWRRNQIILIRLKLLYFFFDFISQVHDVLLLHTMSSALHNWTHFGDWLILSFQTHSALSGELKSRRLNGKSWIRRKRSRGQPMGTHTLLAPLLVCASHWFWQNASTAGENLIEEIIPQSSPSDGVLQHADIGLSGGRLPATALRPELIPSFPPISHLKATLIVEMCFQYSSVHPPPPTPTPQ